VARFNNARLHYLDERATRARYLRIATDELCAAARADGLEPHFECPPVDDAPAATATPSVTPSSLVLDVELDTLAKGSDAGDAAYSQYCEGGARAAAAATSSGGGGFGGSFGGTTTTTVDDNADAGDNTRLSKMSYQRRRIRVYCHEFVLPASVCSARPPVTAPLFSTGFLLFCQAVKAYNDFALFHRVCSSLLPDCQSVLRFCCVGAELQALMIMAAFTY
jgi:hypothetical protein